MAAEIVLAKLGVEMETAVLTEWLVEEGAKVAADQVVLTVETEKVSFEVSAPSAGLLHRVAEEGEEYEVGALLGYLAESAEELAGLAVGGGGTSAQPAMASPPRAAARAAEVGGTLVLSAGSEARDAVAERRRGEPLASPLARRVAAESGLALADAVGSGPGGKIRKKDVERLVAASGGLGVTVDVPSADDGPGSSVAMPLNPMRKTIARRMVASLQEAAQMTEVREYEVSGLAELRRGLVEHRDTVGFKLSFTDLLVRATAIALRKVPALNATFADGELRQHADANIGIAVAVPDGLLVPVLRGVGKASMRDLHTRMEALIVRARERELSAEELAGGTFTVTNIGSYGSQFGTPILNVPEVGILATGTIQRKPVVRDGEVAVGATMHLSLTVDHRFVDGETSGAFMNVFAELFAEPELILLG